jgi:hypothetical protein
MYRAGLLLLFLFLVLGAIGWWSSDYAWQEWVRLLAVGCMTVGMLLLIIDYARSPEAPDEGKP